MLRGRYGIGWMVVAWLALSCFASGQRATRRSLSRAGSISIGQPKPRPDQEKTIRTMDASSSVTSSLAIGVPGMIVAKDLAITS